MSQSTVYCAQPCEHRGVTHRAAADLCTAKVLIDARSVLDVSCECQGNPPTYEYRKDKRQHCMWCDGLREI